MSATEEDIGYKVATGLLALVVFILSAVFSDSTDDKIKRIERETGCRVQKDASRTCTPLTVPNGRYSYLYWLCCDADAGEKP